MPKPYRPLACFQCVIGLITTCIIMYLFVLTPYIKIVSQCIFSYWNVALCIKIASPCIEIHFDEPWNFLHLWNAFPRKFGCLHYNWNVYQNSSFVSKYILINSWTELTRSLEGWGWWFFMPSHRMKINIKMHFLYWNGVLTSNCVSHSIKMHSNNTPNLLCSNWLYSFVLKLLGQWVFIVCWQFCPILWRSKVIVCPIEKSHVRPKWFHLWQVRYTKGIKQINIFF